MLTNNYSCIGPLHFPASSLSRWCKGRKRVHYITNEDAHGRRTILWRLLAKPLKTTDRWNHVCCKKIHVPYLSVLWFSRLLNPKHQRPSHRWSSAFARLALCRRNWQGWSEVARSLTALSDYSFVLKSLWVGRWSDSMPYLEVIPIEVTWWAESWRKVFNTY